MNGTITNSSAIAEILARKDGRIQLENYLRFWDEFVAASREFMPGYPAPVEPEVIGEIRKVLAEQ